MSLKIRNLTKLISVLIAVILLVSMIPTANLSAATYKGSGTKKDPYLVTNAEQLDGIRNNLSAHYKLANTIDMSSVENFDPIGFIAKPFTGTFTCDTDKNGLPKYAIKNITINNKRGLINKHAPNSGNTPDYKKDNSKWETGLFGMTKGAEISNIYVLNANVICSVVGELSHVYPNGLDQPYIPVKGADEQGTGVLAGMARSTTFVNCAATGKVDSKSNYTGGLLGRVEENTFIEYSWADVDVKSTGCWGAGAFIGQITGDTTVQFCYATGDIEAPMKKSFNNETLDLVGGFCYVEKNTSIISDCYSTGKVSSNGYSFALNSEATSDCFMNCWTIGKVNGLTAKPSVPKKTSDNCFVLNETGHRNSCFTPASKAEIANAFKDLEGWEIGADGYPRISKIPVLKDASIYVPSTNNNQSTSSQQGSSSQSGGSANGGSNQNSNNSQSGGSANSGSNNSQGSSNKGNSNTQNSTSSSISNNTSGSTSGQSGNKNTNTTSNQGNTQSSTTSKGDTSSSTTSLGGNTSTPVDNNQQENNNENTENNVNTENNDYVENNGETNNNGNTENNVDSQENTKTETINAQVKSEKQVLMIVLAALIVAISVLTGAVLVTMLVKGKKPE